MKYKPGGKDVDRFFEAEKPVIVCQTTDKTGLNFSSLRN